MERSLWYSFFGALLLISAVLCQEVEDVKEWEEEVKEMPSRNTRICSARPEYGHCKGHRPLWYYSPIYKECLNFFYSNCGGNRNRFFSEAECKSFCMSDEYEAPKPRKYDK